MPQEPRSLPQGAGATGTSNQATGFASTGADRTTTSNSGTSTSTGYSGTDARRPETSFRSDFSRNENFDSYHEGRDLIVAERSHGPSTATVVGAAMAGAIAGAAIPFMLSGRSSSRSRSESTAVQESIIVNRPARELYDFWRDFTNFPQFMDNIKSVEKIDDRRSHWVIKAPAGTSVEFDSRIVDDVPGRMIAWESEENASVPNRGRVEFIETSSGQGTNVRATISYDPPAGAAGRLVGKLFQREPGTQARQDLQRFKELMENRSR